MLSQESIQTFKDNGFLLGDRILDDDQVEELRQELDRVIDSYEDSTQPQPVRIANLGGDPETVSYTHLTLPTILLV